MKVFLLSARSKASHFRFFGSSPKLPFESGTLSANAIQSTAKQR